MGQRDECTKLSHTNDKLPYGSETVYVRTSSTSIQPSGLRARTGSFPGKEDCTREWVTCSKQDKKGVVSMSYSLVHRCLWSRIAESS